jgi:hypothetical protein
MICTSRDLDVDVFALAADFLFFSINIVVLSE